MGAPGTWLEHKAAQFQGDIPMCCPSPAVDCSGFRGKCSLDHVAPNAHNFVFDDCATGPVDFACLGQEHRYPKVFKNGHGRLMDSDNLVCRENLHWRKRVL